MVTLTVPTTFVLDPDTEQKIDRLSQLWNVSTAEVVRRSVSEVDQKISQAEKEKTLSALEALERLQDKATLTQEEAEEWKRESRLGWEESFARREEAQTRTGN